MIEGIYTILGIVNRYGRFDAYFVLGSVLRKGAGIFKTQKNPVNDRVYILMEPPSGLEPETPSLPWMCSTY